MTKLMDELKNQRTIGLIVAVVICIFIYVSTQEKITTITSEYDKKVSVLTEEMSKDSTTIKTKQTTIDSFATVVFKHSMETSSSSSVKKGTGVKTVVTVIEKPTGEKTTTTTTDSFTGTSVDNNNYTKVVDSVASVFKKKTDSLSTEISSLQEQVKIKKIDTVVHEKTITIIKEPIPKKLDLSALVGVDVSTQNSFVITPVIGVGARYDFLKPFFIQTDIRKVGNIISYSDPNQYKLGGAIGIHFGL